jgi:hypothetical protein
MTGPPRPDPPRPGPPRPGRPRPGHPCAAFAEAAVLAVDRELGPAEAARLEVHLELCASCRSLARRSAGVSAALRRWDRETNDLRPPARLALAVRAALRQEGAWRRRERRLVLLNRVTVAASVVLAFGPAIGLGLSAPRADSQAPAVVATAAPHPRPPAAAAGVRPSGHRARVASALSGPEASAVAGFDAGAPATFERDTFAVPRGGGTTPFLDAFTRLEVRRIERRRDERAFLAEVGEPGEWLRLSGGEERLLTLGARAYLERKAAELGTGLFEHLGRSRDPGAHVYAPVPEAVPTDVRVADVVSVPLERAALDAWLAREPWSPTAGLQVHFIDVPPAREGSAGPRLVWDLEEAVRVGAVTLGEGVEHDLVVLVRDVAHPVFVPAGELVAGGLVDRVVARGLWIPAVRGEARHALPCLPVSSAAAASGDLPRPTGRVAGPELRALLAGGADAGAVASLVHRQLRRLGGMGHDYSLLDAYEGYFHGGTYEQLRLDVERRFLGRRAGGFVAAGVRGAFVGLEVSDLPPLAAARLLSRLLAGYLVETKIAVHEAAQSPIVSPREATPLRATLFEVLGHGATFRASGEPGEGPRVLRLPGAVGSVTFEVVERAPGLRALASGLGRQPSGARYPPGR